MVETQTIVYGAIGVALWWLYKRFVSAPQQRVFKPIVVPKKVEPRDFTLAQLAAFDGKDEDTPIYIAAKGKVFDMSNARNFYGPGSPYHIFAGRDASRALALNSTDVADVENRSLEGLDGFSMDSLDGWFQKYEMKYPCVGDLID